MKVGNKSGISGGGIGYRVDVIQVKNVSPATPVMLRISKIVRYNMIIW